MALISTEDAKAYLRVDSSDEDATVGILLASAIRLCIDIARLSDDQWEAIDSDATSSDEYTEAELSAIRETMKVAILYTCAYLFEHREEADHHALTMTLRSLLFAIREYHQAEAGRWIMTYDDVITMLEEAGLPLAYDHFAEGESPDPPFLVFLYPGSDNMFADDTVFKKIDELNIELYTDVKDPETETQIEDILIAHDLPYEKSEVWIESEKLYEVLYQTQIIGG